jgi:DNA-binding transcriptional MerR regulator
MSIRIGELAAATGTTVDTVRFYQAKGLLPPPRRQGRAALYSDDHVEQLRRIRDLKEKGFTLASIKRLLDGVMDEADVKLAETLVSERGRTGRLLTLEQLAQQTGISPALVEAVEREGLIEPVDDDGRKLYTEADAVALSRGLELVSAGLPLSELLALAREHDRVMRTVAQRAVDVFIRYVREPVISGSTPKQESAQKLIDAFNTMLPATADLVARHFERLLIREGLARLAQDGDEAGLKAVRTEAGRE